MQAAEARQRLTGQGLPTSSGGSLGPTGRKQSELCLHKWLHRKYYPFHHHQQRGLEDPVSCSKWDASGVTGLPWWLSGKESTCQCRRHGFNPWVREILWRMKWQPTPASLPGKSDGQRSLVGYSPWDHKGLDTTWWLTCTLVFYQDQSISDNAWLGSPPDWLLLNLTCQGG